MYLADHDIRRVDCNADIEIDPLPPGGEVSIH